MRYYILNKKTGRLAEVIPFNGSLSWLAVFQKDASTFDEFEIDAALEELGVSRDDVQLMEARQHG